MVPWYVLPAAPREQAPHRRERRALSRHHGGQRPENSTVTVVFAPGVVTTALVAA